MKRNLFISLMCIISLILLISHAWAISYQVTDIGAFGGAISGINNLGTLTGTVNSTAFTWSASTGFVYLNHISGYTKSFAEGINDSGKVVGYSYSTSDAYSAALWEEGNPAVNIGAFRAKDINNVGQVAGDSYFWSESLGLEYLGAGVDAYALNDSGVVVGERDAKGFIWTRDTGIRDIDFSVPDMHVRAVGINNSGQVLLHAYNLQDPGYSYLWQDGQGVSSFGSLGTDGRASAYDINNLGQVVGQSNYQAFVWDSVDGIQALPLSFGFQRAAGSVINDNGVIAGYAYDAQWSRHLVLWTPVPEPSSLAALTFALFSAAGAAVARRRRG